MANWESLDAQALACGKCCELRGIKSLTTAFKDAFSWKSSNRPQLNAAIQYAIIHKADYFVIFDLDRFSREWYASYKIMKENLASHWISLIDSKNVIGESRMAVENDDYDMSKYKWAKENPTEMAEMVYSAQAEIEGKKILQRTIPQSILLVQKWYWVRSAVIGFQNKRVKVDGKKRTILEPHPLQSLWLVRMFELRADGILSDEDIVLEINRLWYRSWKHSIELTVKQMQAYIKKPIYAGVLVEEWTNFKPIYAQFPWLVSLDIWNKANKGKYKIVKHPNSELQLLDWKSLDFQPVIGRRKKYDPELPYRNLIKSSALQWQFITWSRSRNKTGNLFAYYHPLRQKGRVGENIAKKEFEECIDTFFKEIQFNPVLRQIFMDRLELLFNSKKSELVSQRLEIENRLKSVMVAISNLQEKACAVDPSYTMILKNINEQLESLDKERQLLEIQLQDQEARGFDNLENFQRFCLHFIEHLGELLSTSQNLEEKRIIFQFVFSEIPTYQDIINRTPKIYPIFVISKTKKESPIMEDSCINPNWQGGSESNWDQGLWRSLY